MPESNVIKIESSVNELKDKVGDMAEQREVAKEHDKRIRDMEAKMPLIEEWRSNSNKVRNTVTGAIIVAAMVGGIIGRFS